MVFDEFFGTGARGPTRRLLTASVRRAVEKGTPGLRLADWAAHGGPDGEQFLCTVDLVHAALRADPVLAAHCATAVGADDGHGAEQPLHTLTAHLQAGGYEGAAEVCQEALRALAPAPGRLGLNSLAARSRPA
jgi:hypothetical protein